MACAKDGDQKLFRSHSQILSAIIIALLEKDITQDAKSTRQRAFFTQVRKLSLSQNSSRTTIIALALHKVTSIVEQDASEVLELLLITCTNLLSPVDAISIASSVLQIYTSGEEAHKAKVLFFETVDRCLDKIRLQREKGIGDPLSADIAEHFLYIISTHEVNVFHRNIW